MSGEWPTGRTPGMDLPRTDVGFVMAKPVGTSECGGRMLGEGRRARDQNPMAEAEAQRWVERVGGEPDEDAATLLPDGAAAR